MNNTGKILLSAAVGAGVGWIVGEILADHFAPEYYTEEELGALIEANGEILEENNYHLDQIKPVKTIDDIRETMYVSKDKKDYTKYFSKEEKEPLEKLVRKYNEDELIEDEDNEELDEEITYEAMEDDSYLEEVDLDNRDKTQPYIMTIDEWVANETDLPQITLCYYPEDDILTDSKDRPLNSVEKLLGPDALDNFGTFSEDNSIVYVCNPRVQAEYEVINMEGSYHDLVIGGLAKKSKAKPKQGVAVVTNIFDEFGGKDPEDLEDEQDEESDS